MTGSKRRVQRPAKEWWATEGQVEVQRTKWIQAGFWKQTEQNKAYFKVLAPGLSPSILLFPVHSQAHCDVRTWLTIYAFSRLGIWAQRWNVTAQVPAQKTERERWSEATCTQGSKGCIHISVPELESISSTLLKNVWPWTSQEKHKARGLTGNNHFVPGYSEQEQGHNSWMDFPLLTWRHWWHCVSGTWRIFWGIPAYSLLNKYHLLSSF